MEFEFEKKGYTCKNGNIRSNLITIEAEKIAEYLVPEKGKGVTKSQLRAFYSEVKVIENKIKNQSGEFEEESFKKNLYRILMLKSKAIYRTENKGSGLPKSFGNFIKKNVERIQMENSTKSFENFSIFFEAVVGYCYGRPKIKE